MAILQGDYTSNLLARMAIDLLSYKALYCNLLYSRFSL